MQCDLPPLRPLWGGPGSRFEPGTGDLEAGSLTTIHLRDHCDSLPGLSHLNLAEGLGHLLELILVAVEHLVVGHGDLGDADGEEGRLLALAAGLQPALPLGQHRRLVQET